MMISIPVSYFLQAPASATIPGLGWGAMGMAIKIILLSIITVNIVTWWIGKQLGKPLDWTYQVVGMVGTLLPSCLAFFLAKQLAASFSLGLYLQAGVACLLYFLMVATLLWQFPWIAGTSREELRSILNLKNFKKFQQ